MINLDSVYSAVTVNSWIVLVKPQSVSDDGNTTHPPYAELYKVKNVGDEAKADFNISAKTTRIEISGENINKFGPRDTTVDAQSEELPLAETPITDPVWKDEIALDNLITPLAEGRKIVVTGRRLRARIEKMKSKVSLAPSDELLDPSQLEPGDELIVLALPTDSPKGPGMKRWQLMDLGGLEGYVDAPDGKVTLIAADEKDSLVSEAATVKRTGSDDLTHSKLYLSTPLSNVFDRTTVTINANVALATHGETVANEVLGSGNAGLPYQTFALRNAPLTYTSADTPSGARAPSKFASTI